MRPGSEQEMSEAIRAASGPVRIVGAELGAALAPAR